MTNLHVSRFHISPNTQPQTEAMKRRQTRACGWMVCDLLCDGCPYALSVFIGQLPAQLFDFFNRRIRHQGKVLTLSFTI